MSVSLTRRKVGVLWDVQIVQHALYTFILYQPEYKTWPSMFWPIQKSQCSNKSNSALFEILFFSFSSKQNAYYSRSLPIITPLWHICARIENPFPKAANRGYMLSTVRSTADVMQKEIVFIARQIWGKLHQAKSNRVLCWKAYQNPLYMHGNYNTQYILHLWGQQTSHRCDHTVENYYNKKPFIWLFGNCIVWTEVLLSRIIFNKLLNTLSLLFLIYKHI